MAALVSDHLGIDPDARCFALHPADELIVLRAIVDSPPKAFDGFEDFANDVAPNLQQRGVFHREYAGTMLRDHLGALAQYGLDPTIMRLGPSWFKRNLSVPIF